MNVQPNRSRAASVRSSIAARALAIGTTTTVILLSSPVAAL
jgi:hypothetical protein